MGRNIKLTDDSMYRVNRHIRKPTLKPYDSNTISRLLNRQVKSAMHELLREEIRAVLGGLEKVIKKRSEGSWAEVFCIISILCICIEEVQIAVNGFAMHTKFYGLEKDRPMSTDCIELCRMLDDLPHVHLVELFHGTYKIKSSIWSDNMARASNSEQNKGHSDQTTNLMSQICSLLIEFGTCHPSLLQRTFCLLQQETI